MIEDVAVIGIAVETTQVERGRKSLASLAEMGGKTEAAIKGVGSASAGASGDVRRLGSETEKAGDAANRASGGFDSISRAANQLKAVVAGYLSLQTAKIFIETADAMSLLDARLKLAVKSTLELREAQAALFKVAQDNSVGISETITLYTRMAEPIRRAGGEMREIIGVTNAFQKALQLGGVSAQEAASATLQFSQALGSGVLAGDEFKSLAEASPRLLRAIADGANLPIESLKKLGSEGKLTASTVANALLNVSQQLNSEFATLPDSVGKAMTRLSSEVKMAVKDINENSGLTLGLAGMVDEAAKLVPTIKDELTGAFQSVGQWVQANRDWLLEAWDAAKGLAAQTWEIVKAAASVGGAITEWIGQTGLAKTAIESISLLVAGLQDGVTLLGGAFATVGSLILKTVLAPLNVALTSLGKINAFLGNDEAAASYAQAAQSIRDFAGAGAKYGDEIVDAFLRGDTAVGRLAASMRNAGTETAKAGKEAAAAATSFTKLTSPGGGGDGSKNIKRTQSAYESLIKSLSEKIAMEKAELDGGLKLTENQKLRAKFAADLNGALKGLSAAQRSVIENLLNEHQAAEKAKISYRDAMKTAQEVAAARKKEADGIREWIQAQEEAARQSLKSVKDRISDMKDEAAAVKKSIELNVSLAEAVEMVAIARLEEKQAGFYEGSEGWLAIQKEIDARRVLLGLVAGKEAREANKKAADEAAKDWERVSQTIGDTLADYIMGGGRDAASYLKRLFATLVLRPVVETVVGGALNAVGLGSSSGGSGILGMANNASSAYSMFNGTWGASLLGNSYAYGAAVPGLTMGSQQAAMLAAQTGEFGWAGLSATSGAGGAGSGAMAGLGTAAAVIAVPLIAGLIAGYLDNGDRMSGAAYATSGGKDRLSEVLAGSLNPNVNTGDLPDRQALMQWLTGQGASQSQLDGLNDRQLHRMMLLAEGELGMDRDGGPMMNWRGWADANSSLADFYRGPGYAFPEDLNWWEVEDRGSHDKYRSWDSFYVDPAIVETSRKLSESILGPLDSITKAIGGSDAFKVTTGFGSNPEDRNPIWGGLNIQRNGENLLDWGMKEFGSSGEYIRDMYSDTLGTLKQLDLPNWAKGQVDATQAELLKLEGDKIGEQAATLYAQASGSISATITQIATLIKIVPELGGASQDAVYNIGQALGGLDQFTSLYSGFVQNFYTESERFKYIRDSINDTLSAVDLGVTAETTRDQFRALVDAQDLTTESGQRAFAVLMQVSSAFAEITPVVEEAVSALDQQIQQMAETIGSDFTSVLTQGLLGNLTGADLGGAMADVVIGGVYNALASNVGQQISEMMMSTVVTPLITAAMTGSSIAESVSQAAISNMVASAQAAAQALNAVLSSPEFQEALSGIDAAFKSITVSMPRTPYYTAYQPAKQVSDYQKAVKSSADEAARAAEAIRKSWQSISDTLVDEVRRIRGELADAGEQSALYWEAQFAIDTAAARSGDEEAAKRLTDISRSLLDAAGREATTMLGMQQMRAYVAQSLQDTAGYAQAIAGGALNTAPKAKAPATITPAPVFTNQAPIVISADPGLLEEIRQLRQIVNDRLGVISENQVEGLRIERREEALGKKVYVVAAP